MRYVVICAILIPLVIPAQQGSWTETTREDFSDGWYERDMYCTYRASTAEPDSGALEFVPRFDFTNDGWIDLVVSNKPTSTGWTEAKRDWILVYTGDAQGYNTQRYLQYATNNAAEVDGADLDLDGYTDLISCHYYSPSYAKVGGVCIYWGTPNGPSDTDTTMLPATQQTEAVYVADVNKDGWIDILSSDYSRFLDTTFQGNFDSVAIFWGGPNRSYSGNNATFLPARTARHNFQVADFDQDGYYDIFVVNYFGIENFIYWGSATGFHPTDRSSIPFLSTYPHGVTTADFNRDGWLDYCITGMQSVQRAYIYYGNPANPRVFSSPVALNTGKVFGGCAAFDYNQDDWLDLIFYRGDAGDTAISTKFKPWIYLGGQNGFSDSNRLEFGARDYNLSGGFLTDFNRDGIVDLFVHSWNLFDSSGVLWGPDFYSHTQLYCNVDHHSQCRDMGHVYDRRQREPYISNVFDAGSSVNWDVITKIDSTPGTSRIALRMRTGPTPTPDGSWTEWVALRSNGSIPDIAPSGDTVINRYYQYEANLSWNYAADLPVLYEVTTYWGPGITVEPDYDSITYPAIEIVYPLTVTNDGHASDVINVTTQGTRSDWQLAFYDSGGNQMTDSNGDGIRDVDSVAGQGGATVFSIGLMPPSNSLMGDVDTTIVWVHSTNNETVKDSAVLVTRVLPIPALLLLPNQDSAAYPGNTIRYRLTLTNSGNADDVVDMSTTGTTSGWGALLLNDSGQPMTDSDSDGAPDLGSVPRGGGRADLFVDVTIPAGAPGGQIDTTWVIATSSLDTTITSQAWLMTEVIPPPDTLVAVAIAPDTFVQTQPETPIGIPLRVENLGTRDDTFDIEVTFEGDAWFYRLLTSGGAELPDANGNGVPDVGMVGVGQETSFMLEVTPPPGVGNDFTGTSPLNNSTIALVTARSTLDTTVSDEAQDTVAVLPLLNVHNFPNPFAGPTTFYFSLPEAGKVTLRIYNRAGEYLETVVEDQSYQAGVHFEPWDGLTSNGQPVAPGVLLYSFRFVPDDSRHRSITIVKTALSQGGGS